jgi:succinyl-CoA synthetase beta subunit
MVIRLTGTNEETAHDVLRRAGLIATRSMSEAVERAVGMLGKGQPP